MIYLDHAAATPVSKRVLGAMQKYFADDFFNPSAAYLPATRVRKDFEMAKSQIAETIGAKGADIIVTSGATESINLAFKSIGENAKTLVSAVEHPAVLENAKQQGNYEIINVDKTGRLDIDDLKKKITNDVQLVSVCLASSELGTIQPLAEIASIIKEERQKRLVAGNRTPIYLHADASQGLGIIEMKVNRLGVDMLTLNAAKVYGPKGVGVLWVSRDVKLKPVSVGGGQERGLRSGTENVPGVVGFAVAVQDSEKHLAGERKRTMRLRDELKKILSENEQIIFLGNPKNQLVNFLPISVPGLDAERLIFKLEAQEVYVSTGAACSASKGIKSQTLRAIGLNDKEIAGSLRISLGKLNDEANVADAGRKILQAIDEENVRLAGKEKK